VVMEIGDDAAEWCRAEHPYHPFKGEWCLRVRGHTGQHWHPVSVLKWDQEDDA
jgi:hypothetical protein